MNEHLQTLIEGEALNLTVYLAGGQAVKVDSVLKTYLAGDQNIRTTMVVFRFYENGFRYLTVPLANIVAIIN